MKVKQIFSAFTLTFFLLGSMSCSKLGDFEKQLEELESKVVAIETQISVLNQNVAALKYLTEGAVITEVNEVAGGYELTLSDGRKLSLHHGVNGSNGANGTTPTISINENGYWVINGVVQTVNAYGQDGVTPRFSVDADGYWVVSYNGGVSYDRVKDSNGNDVKAKAEISTGSGVEVDSYFSSVEVNGNLFVLTLKDGTVVEVPIVKGFSFVIKKNGQLVEGVQKVVDGMTVTFDVEQTGVASAAIVACPAGFDVELTETTLSITAYNEPDNKYITKASASLSKDLAILVVSKNGLSILSKMQLEKTEPQPEATLSNATHECYSFNSVKLNANVVNGDRVYCIIKAASEAAATLDELKAKEAVAVAEGVASLNKGDLTPETAYVAYYLASDGTKYSEVQTFEFSTRAIDENNLYEKYANGETITVAGLEVNKTNYPQALYICRGTTTRGAGKAGLVFVEAHSEISANFDSGITGLIVVGTNPAVRSNANRAGVSYLTGTSEVSDVFALANINYTSGADVFQFNGALENVVLDNCQFNVADTKSLFKSTSAANTFSTLSVSNSDFGFTGTAYFGNMGGASVTKVALTNNVFYGTTEMTSFYLYKGGKITTVELNSNTFYQTTIGSATANDDALFLVTNGITTFNASKNYILNCSAALTANRYLVRPAPTEGTVPADNYYVKQSATVYFCNGSKPAWANHPVSKGAPANFAENWDPANGKFILKGYTLDNQAIGATR